MPDAESLRLGRRYTSGKECLPLCLTLGNLLKRLERERDPDRRFALLMTTTNGPCREGTYNLLNQITLERLGWKDRVRIWSPADTGYFDDMPGGLSALVFTTMMASDLLLGALHDVRPAEIRAGAAQEIYDRHFARLLQCVETAAAGDLSLPAALWQVATGRLFGLSRMLAEAADGFLAPSALTGRCPRCWSWARSTCAARLLPTTSSSTSSRRAACAPASPRSASGSSIPT